MGQELRPYQQQARDRIHAEWDAGHTRTLLVLPTGTGKTIVFASVAADQVRAGDRVLILAHRGELLEQAADKLQRSTGLVQRRGKGRSHLPGQLVPGGGGQRADPACATARLERFPQDYFGTIIIDEAHHAITDGYQPHPGLLQRGQGAWRHRHAGPRRHAQSGRVCSTAWPMSTS